MNELKEKEIRNLLLDVQDAVIKAYDSEVGLCADRDKTDTLVDSLKATKEALKNFTESNPFNPFVGL